MKTVKFLLAFFIFCLLISGLTVFPMETELRLAGTIVPPGSSLHSWLERVLSAYLEMKGSYPFLLYGYDWLAFAHIVLAILFIGPYKDPVKNNWVIQFGLIACMLVIPLALIAGTLHSIPFGWRCIDMSFGIVGFVVLAICQLKLRQLT